MMNLFRRGPTEARRAEFDDAVRRRVLGARLTEQQVAPPQAPGESIPIPVMEREEAALRFMTLGAELEETDCLPPARAVADPVREPAVGLLIAPLGEDASQASVAIASESEADS